MRAMAVLRALLLKRVKFSRGIRPVNGVGVGFVGYRGIFHPVRDPGAHPVAAVGNAQARREWSSLVTCPGPVRSLSVSDERRNGGEG